MQRKRLLLIASLCFTSSMVNAADLLEVYQQALTSDPTYQQAISQSLADKQGVPISIAAILPTIGVTANPSISRQAFSGAAVSADSFSPRNNTVKNYTLALTATQTVFDYTQFVTVAGAMSSSKQADATLNAALQDLMTRVANAYFTVLKSEDDLSYSEASKIAYSEQLDQVKQQYDVGLKTITEVYTAQASYDASVANVIAAQTTLANNRENLRVITGKYYPHLSKLSEQFPLVSPRPKDVEVWVDTAQRQNWNIKAKQYAVDVAKQNIRQQFGGHIPTVNIQGTLDREYTNNINGYRNIATPTGPTTETDRSVQLNINVPLFAGGGVVAETNQATFAYQTTQQQLELTQREAFNTTRQSYLGVIAGISQIDADRQAIKSAISSLQGMEVSYRVGTETLVDVLNQQQKVFENQKNYARDRYTFVNNLLALKKAAGTLSFNDLSAINVWLINGNRHLATSKSSKHFYKDGALSMNDTNDDFPLSRIVPIKIEKKAIHTVAKKSKAIKKIVAAKKKSISAKHLAKIKPAAKPIHFDSKTKWIAHKKKITHTLTS